MAASHKRIPLCTQLHALRLEIGESRYKMRATGPTVIQAYDKERFLRLGSVIVAATLDATLALVSARPLSRCDSLYAE